MITLNYRLGAFGWLAIVLAEGSANSLVANYGMMDQIAALRWVHENIRAFGVIKQRPLFGRPQGRLPSRCSCSRAVTRPVQKAILNRCPVVASALNGNGEAAGRIFRAVGYDRNGPDPRAIDAGMILAAEKILLSKSSLSESSRSFGPAEDGMLVKGDVATGFGAGRESRIPLIIGANEDETVFGSEPDFNEELELAGDSVDELRKLYP